MPALRALVRGSRAPGQLLARATRSVRGLRGVVAAASLAAELARVPPKVAHLLLTRRTHGSVPTEVPVPGPSPAYAASLTLDEILVAVGRRVLLPSARPDLRRAEEEMAEARRLYERRGWLDRPSSYHDEPPPLRAPTIAGRNTLGRAVEHLTFESEYEPHPDEPGRERWLGYTENRTAHAWLLRHAGGPRPWIVCIPGAGMGIPAIDLAMFRALRLHHALGLNVLVPVLPRHGPRKRGRSLEILLPTVDLLDNVHGVAQALWDVRRLLSWIRSQGGEAIGMQGVSLGAYMAALCAAFEGDLGCVIAGVPAADFTALFTVQLTHPDQPPRYSSVPDLPHVLHRVVSPLAVHPIVPRDRLFVFAGLADRMADPVHQARLLWLHWDRPNVCWYRGGHLGFVWSRTVAEFVGDALQGCGFVIDVPRRASSIDTLTARSRRRAASAAPAS